MNIFLTYTLIYSLINGLNMNVKKYSHSQINFFKGAGYKAQNKYINKYNPVNHFYKIKRSYARVKEKTIIIIQHGLLKAF